MMSLSLRLLGTFAVSLGGRRVEAFATDKERALLAYLAVENDRPHRRDALAALLWPDLPAGKARNNFRVTLHRLRQAVDHPGADTIQATRATVRINPAVELEVDANVLAQEMEEVRRHGDGDVLCPECHGRLTAATELYRGEFLAGFILDGSPAFNEWARLKREWIHRRLLNALHILAQYQQRRGESERAQRYAHRQIELEPWRERAHRQLMRALACAGDYSAALAQFDTCREIMADELGVEPSQKTVRLYDEILAARETLFRPLPNPARRLIGRDEELAHIVDGLADPACRLLTLVGPGGVGKSRLALEAARKQTAAFLHGVCYVPLASVDSADRLIGAVSRAANYTFQNRGDRRSELLGFLEKKEMLLVLDNVEHLLDKHLLGARKLLPALLAGAPGLKVLVTSRVRLNLKGENVFALQGLAVPEPDGAEGGDQVGAVKLFVERAREAHPGFELSPQSASSVVQLCRFLAGMPLAIELAGAWSRALAPGETLARMEHGLDFLESPAPDVPARQRSVRASFEHSWALLDDDGRDALMKLSIFRGGFTVEAAQEIAGASLQTVTALVDHSLLWHDVSAGRLDMHELLRAFAGDKLAQAGKSDSVRSAHSAHYLGLLCRLEDDVLGGKQQLDAMDTIDADSENVRVAWLWAIENETYERLERSVVTVTIALDHRGRHREAEQLFRQSAKILEARVGDRCQGLLGQIMAWLARFANRDLRCKEAIDLLERSLEIARQRNAQAEVAFCLQEMGSALRMHAGMDQARPLIEESLAIASAIGSTRLQVLALTELSRLILSEGKREDAFHHTERLLALCRELGDNFRLCGALYHLGVNKCLAGGWYEEGKRHLEECFNIQQQLKDPRGLGMTQAALALYTTRVEGNNAKARTLAEQSLAIGRSVNDPLIKSVSLVTLGDIACWKERYREAACRAKESLRIVREVNNYDTIFFARDTLALALCGLGLFHEAKSHLNQAIRLSLRNSTISYMLSHLAGMALVLDHEGDDERAIELYVLASSHPARTRAWLEELPLYVRFRTELEDKVPPETFARAWERGKELDPAAVAAEVLEALE